MNLDLFNNLGKSIKESNIIQNFVKELGEFLENNLERNDESLVQNILNGRTLTTKYRDKINEARARISAMFKVISLSTNCIQ